MRRLLLIMSLVLLVGILSASLPVRALDLFQNPCNGSGSGSALCQENNSQSGNPLTGNSGLLLEVAQIIGFLAGVAAVIVIIVAGIQFVSSAGDPAKAETAKTTIVYALVGLLVILLATGLVSLILNQLG